jgi:hypothetical protein
MTDLKAEEVIMLGEDAIPLGIQRLAYKSPLYPRR